MKLQDNPKTSKEGTTLMHSAKQFLARNYGSLALVTSLFVAVLAAA
jgi:hypothetical protein